MLTALEPADVAPLEGSAPGVVLIWDEAAAPSLLAGERPAAPAGYAELAAIILARSDLDVIVHLPRHDGGGAALREAVAGVYPPLGSHPGRLRVTGAMPLEALLPGVDFLVSFASAALIRGCRSGLKPIQIGAALIGSGGFSEIFPDSRAFADALAAHRLAGSLSVGEYELFEEFCRAVRAVPRYRRGEGPRAAWRRARDPVVRECRRLPYTWRDRIRAIAGAVANPLVTMRLYRGSFRLPGAGR